MGKLEISFIESDVMIGVVTYVHGWYLDYIPIYVYSINRAYPEYGVKIFVDSELPEYIQDQISNKCVVEKLSSPHVKGGSKKTYYMRWLIPYDYLKEFRSVFICDVDFLMLPEEPPMHVQRDILCKKIGLPFANFLRNPVEGYPSRITGWHYLQVEPYYEKMTPVIDSIINDPNFDISNPPSYCYDNGKGEKQWGQEALIYNMIHAAFVVDDRIKESNIGFANHHGLHLGPFRGKIPELITQGNSSAIKHVGKNLKYWNMRSNIRKLINDEKFLELKSKIKDRRVLDVLESVHKYFQYKIL